MERGQRKIDYILVAILITIQIRSSWISLFTIAMPMDSQD